MDGTDADVAAHFGDRAAGYDLVSPWVHETASLEPIAKVISACRARSVLDLGSGSGAVPRFLASTARTPLYVGLDRSLEMLKQQPSSTACVVGDAAKLPFPSGVFDLALCRQAFHYFANPLDVLAEVARVLAPSGWCLLAQITPFDDPEDQRWWKTSVRLRQPLRLHKWTSAGLEQVLCRSGFAITEVTHLESRSSLLSWLDRYPIEARTREQLVTHFSDAPTSVKEQRNFTATRGDIEYTIRWTMVLARIHPQSTTSRSPEIVGHQRRTADSSAKLRPT